MILRVIFFEWRCFKPQGISESNLNENVSILTQGVSELRKFAKTVQVVGIYLCTTENNPVLKALRWRGFFPIGGNLQILCNGEVFIEKRPWAFFASDRNI
jgi:hypothetical protein